ncbi:MAG: PEP-CTERM sorting domain-containing protein, partial [Planctomycetes bacterium]|nr:PEP-CTERM sorting domain-containing protein [Planctomycetota bacterium]
MATKHSLAIAVSLVLAAATSAYAGAEIKLVGDPDQELYDPAQPITVSIFANMTEQPINDPVLLRGIQFDFNATDPQIGLPASMDFVNPMGLYAEFENLPIPATLWPGAAPFPAGMIELILGEDVLLGTVDITAQDELGTTRTLDVLNAGEPDTNAGGSLKFGFGIDKDDPITDWRGSNGDLTGGTLDITTVPEPGTVGLFLLAIGAAGRR